MRDIDIPKLIIFKYENKTNANLKINDSSWTVLLEWSKKNIPSFIHVWKDFLYRNSYHKRKGIMSSASRIEEVER